MTTGSGFSWAHPLKNILVDRLSVLDSQDQDFVLVYLVDHPVIADAELPIAFQRFSKGRPVLVWGLRETRLNRSGDSTVKVAWNLGDILVADSRVIKESERHLGPRSFWEPPCLPMGLGLLSVECR